MVSDQMLEKLLTSQLPGIQPFIIAQLQTNVQEKAETAGKILDVAKFATSATAQ